MSDMSSRQWGSSQPTTGGQSFSFSSNLCLSVHSVWGQGGNSGNVVSGKDGRIITGIALLIPSCNEALTIKNTSAAGTTLLPVGPHVWCCHIQGA